MGYVGFHGRPFWGGKNHQQKTRAVWGPCWGHVGAMSDRRDRVTHVGLKLVHVRLLGPCRGHVGPMMLGLCCYVPVGLTFIYYLILLPWAKMFRLESADALMLEELRF